MTKAGPELMKRALYQAGEQARQWDPQLAHLYWRQMIHHGKTHKQAMGVVMSHLAARILAVLREKRPYQFRDEEGHPLTRAEARRLIQERYTVPQEIRRQRRRRNPRGQENTQTGGQARKRRGMPPATMHEAASAPQSGLGSAIPSELVYASGQAKSR